MLGVAGEILRAVGTKSHYAGREDGADLAQVRGQVEVRGGLGGQAHHVRNMK